MRFELYRVTISRAHRRVTGFLLASDAQRAEEMVVANEIELNQENDGFTIERVDDTLPEDQRLGLDPLLEGAPAGFASFNPQVGWIAHARPAPKLYLYRIEEVSGDEHFVVAPTGDVAAAVYSECVELKEGEASMFRIHDGAVGLKNEALRGLPALLEFGPVGLAKYTEDGWSLV
jgi:hypothetical protein